MTSVFANLRSLLRLYASFPENRVSDQIRGVTLFDGGTASAYENYALVDLKLEDLGAPPQAPQGDCVPLTPVRRSQSALALTSPDEIVAAALAFFADGAQPHIWPFFPGADLALGRLLEARGAARDAVFFDMFAKTGPIRGLEPPGSKFEVVPVSDPASARPWADAVWYGFESGEPAPGSFVSFVDAMIRHPGLLLFALRDRCATVPLFAATGMLACAGGSAGIYYIATRPECRRRGLAARVMNALLFAAVSRGYDRVSLLATPSGRPLYETFGFVVTGEVAIYRFGDA